MTETLKELAAEELLNRRNSRKNLNDFYRYTFKDYIDGTHIATLCSALERVERGETKRLIVSMPPRHSKSETCSIRFPAWCLGKNPEKKIVLASYSDSIASEQSRKSKEVFYSNRYSNVFKNIVPSPNSKDYKTSDKEWETLKRGSVYSVGIGGGLTGRGFDIGIIDDYVKDRQEAASEISKKRILDWYKSTFYTRQSPNASVIIVATRWSVDDLIGKLVEEEKEGEKWEKIVMPALSEDGVALWPERFDNERLMQIKQSIGTFEWSALYQCEPTVREGNRFNIKNINVHDNEDDFPEVVYLRAWDLASSAAERNKDKPDYTVGVLGTIVKRSDGVKELWIKDIQRFQEEAPKRNEIIRRTADKDGARVTVYTENFGAYKDTFAIMRQILSGKNIVRGSHLPGDKSVKASGLEPIFEAGNIHIKNGPWVEAFIKEFREFPYGRHDDICDACAIILGESEKARGGLLIVR